MLKSILLCTVAATTIAEQTTEARCISPPPQVRAEVAIEGCLAVTFGSSHSQVEWFPKPTPLYKEGASYSGVFLIVDVKTSTLLPREADPDGATYLSQWATGTRKEVFVRGSVDEVCPATLYKTVTVTTDPGWLCCDTLPWEGRCLVPSTVVFVTLEKAGML
jgi:hypothetical protein